MFKKNRVLTFKSGLLVFVGVFIIGCITYLVFEYFGYYFVRVIPRHKILTVESLEKEKLHPDVVPLLFGTLFSRGEIHGEKVPKTVSLAVAKKIANKQAMERDINAKLAFVEAISLFFDSRFKVLQWNFLYDNKERILLVEIVGRKIKAYQAALEKPIQWEELLGDFDFNMSPEANVEGINQKLSDFAFFYILPMREQNVRSVKVIGLVKGRTLGIWDPLERKVVQPSDAIMNSIQKISSNYEMAMKGKKGE